MFQDETLKNKLINKTSLSIFNQIYEEMSELQKCPSCIEPNITNNYIWLDSTTGGILNEGKKALALQKISKYKNNNFNYIYRRLNHKR